MSVKAGTSLTYAASASLVFTTRQLERSAAGDAFGGSGYRFQRRYGGEFTLTATGGDYNGAAATLTATESDTTSLSNTVRPCVGDDIADGDAETSHVADGARSNSAVLRPMA